jgi:serine/threonine protein kinase
VTKSLSLIRSLTEQRIRREAYVWINLKHANILKLHGIVEGFGPLPALVSPWMENGSLDSYLKQHTTPSKVEALKMVSTVSKQNRSTSDGPLVKADSRRPQVPYIDSHLMSGSEHSLNS